MGCQIYRSILVIAKGLLLGHFDKPSCRAFTTFKALWRSVLAFEFGSVTFMHFQLRYRTGIPAMSLVRSFCHVVLSAFTSSWPLQSVDISI